jgi:hypothetical protein
MKKAVVMNNLKSTCRSICKNLDRMEKYCHSQLLPIAVAARSKARTVFTRSNTEIMVSNPSEGMDVCVCSVCIYSVST